MKIRNYKKGDEIQIIELFEKVFGRPMQLDVWKWRFENNPAGKHMIKLMWDDDKLVGHYAVSPVRMIIDEREYLTALSMTTMTDPDYGRRGIFGKLANALYDELENKLGVKSIWGFPNNNSHYGFIKNLEWKDLGVLNHVGLPLQNIKPKLNENIRQFEVFTAEHVNIFDQITSDFSVYTKRDQNYLNWRYIEKPNTKYFKFEYISGSVESFIVVKKYPSDIKGIDDLFITELGIDFSHLNLLAEFLSHLVAFFGQEEANLYTWMTIFDKRYIYIERIGFQPTGKSTYLATRANNEKSDTITDFRNWYFSYGDSDVY